MESDVAQPTVVLIPSPLLGPATWTSTARALERRGWHAVVPSLAAVSRSEPPHWPAGTDAIVGAAEDRQVILVPHSNAGLYMPVAVDALRDQVVGIVFVDAALPETGYVAQRDFLNTMVGSDGRLPPWTSWWDEADVAALFPNTDIRKLVEVEQPRMPITYWDHPPPVLDGWDRVPCSYLWFGEPYDKAADTASTRGWTTRQIPGGHLHMVVDPDAVAATVLELGGV